LTRWLFAVIERRSRSSRCGGSVPLPATKRGRAATGIFWPSSARPGNLSQSQRCPGGSAFS